MCRILSKTAAGLFGLAMLCRAAVALAQLPMPASSQFTVTGVLQDASLGAPPAGTVPAFAGGTLTVNGNTIVVPANTVVQYPANSTTWAQMFVQAPPPYGMLASRGVGIVPESGMAMADLPAPLTTWEVNVVGNRVADPVTHVSRYIAALISFSQEALNAHQGFINYIDYARGEMRVGGDLANPNSGTRVRLNDPTGKFGMAHSPDPRFTLDPDNPTVRSQTGYPMGLPRWSPTSPGPSGVTDDPLRPATQRPADALGNPLTIINMPPVGSVVPGGPDPRVQSPFMVGDYLTYSGTLVSDSTGTVGPNPGAQSTYISAHTIIDNCAIYTAPGDNPAYVAIDVTIVGTGGVALAGIQEATVRTRFEGFSTDPTRNVYLFAVDLDPLTGASSDRDWGSINVDPGAFVGGAPAVGAARGRWRFRPPPPKVLSMPTSGMFDPPTRELRAVIATFYSPFAGNLAWTNPAWQPGQTTLYANGLLAGQYHAPISLYLFPEQILGSPIPPMNFETFRWLAQGGQVDSSDMSAHPRIAGQLNPWPGDIVPAPAQGPPVVNAGVNQIVYSGAIVTLNGTVTNASGVPLMLKWVQTAGKPLVTLSTPTLATTKFTAPTVALPVVLTFQLTAVRSTALPLAPISSSTTVTIEPAPALSILNITGVNQLIAKEKLSITATSSPGNGTAVLTMTTVGARDAFGRPITITAPMAFGGGVYTGTLIGTGFNATSILVKSNDGASTQMFNTNILWKTK
jgi:hypothetical protein